MTMEQLGEQVGGLLIFFLVIGIGLAVWSRSKWHKKGIENRGVGK